MKVISCMAPLQATVQSEQKEGVQRRFTFQVAVDVYISLFIFSWPTGKKKQKGVQKAVFNYVHLPPPAACQNAEEREVEGQGLAGRDNKGS